MLHGLNVLASIVALYILPSFLAKARLVVFALDQLLGFLISKMPS
jgi:hypothetical protein